MIQKIRNSSEKGMMVVETTISFTIFIMVVFCIVYLIDIFTIHNKIQFAINGAAREIASYSYLYSASHLQDAENTIHADGASYTQPINTTVNNVVDCYNNIVSLYQQMNEGTVTMESVQESGESVERSISDVTGLLRNPKDTLIGGLYISADYGEYSLKQTIGSGAAELLTKKYLETQTATSATLLLKSYGIKDELDFSDSSILYGDNGQLIDIVVAYDINMEIVQLLIPSAKVHVIQRVTIPAWVDGDGITLNDY